MYLLLRPIRRCRLRCDPTVPTAHSMRTSNAISCVFWVAIAPRLVRVWSAPHLRNNRDYCMDGHSASGCTCVECSPPPSVAVPTRQRDLAVYSRNFLCGVNSVSVFALINTETTGRLFAEPEVAARPLLCLSCRSEGRFRPKASDKCSPLPLLQFSVPS